MEYLTWFYNNYLDDKLLIRLENFNYSLIETLFQLKILCTEKESLLAYIGTANTIGRTIIMPIVGIISDRSAKSVTFWKRHIKATQNLYSASD